LPVAGGGPSQRRPALLACAKSQERTAKRQEHQRAGAGRL
jgi:hypothetical protein